LIIKIIKSFSFKLNYYSFFLENREKIQAKIKYIKKEKSNSIN